MKFAAVVITACLFSNCYAQQSVDEANKAVTENTFSPTVVKVAGEVQIKNLPYIAGLSLEQTKRAAAIVAQNYDARLPVDYGGGISAVKSEFNPATNIWDIYLNIEKTSEFPSLESLKNALATPSFRKMAEQAILEASCEDTDDAKAIRACFMNNLIVRNTFFFEGQYAGDVVLDKNSFCPK